MPQADPFAAYRVSAPAADEGGDPFAAYRVKSDTGTLYDPTRKPASAEDFTETKTSPIREKAKGVFKGAVSSLANLGELAVNAGLIPGVTPAAFNPDMRSPLFTKTEDATTATNTDQRIGKGIETAVEFAMPAYEVGKAGVALAKAAPTVLRNAGPLAVEVASHIPVLGAPVRMIRSAAKMPGLAEQASKILGYVLDIAESNAPKAISNTGGRLVKAGASTSSEDALAKALQELRAPAMPESVELPPPTELPPGYTPRSTVPEPTAPPVNAGGRLVPPQTPTTSQALADALAEARVPEPPARVTTAPEPSLPPGYTPRSTVPKSKAARPAPVQSAIDAAEAKAPPKRAYFLKPAEQVAAEIESAGTPKVKAKGTITQSDLPASWQNHTGQDLFPMTGEEGKAVVAALQDELTARGMSTGRAMALVSNNKQIPVQIRTQLLRALGKSGMAK